MHKEKNKNAIGVAPLAGAWIETCQPSVFTRREHSSLPSRERGLKPGIEHKQRHTFSVAPLAGAWIETYFYPPILFLTCYVAPLAGAWIETSILVHGLLLQVCRSPRGSVD